MGKKKLWGFPKNFFITMEQAEENLKFCDSYNRLPTLLEMAWRLNGTDWLKLLGREWTTCDNVGIYIEKLWDTPFGHCFGDGPILEMMDVEDLAAYEALPEVVTVYRGCYAANKWGLSWSLSRDVAAKFITLNKYRQQGQPLLVKALAKKKDIAAVKLDREEMEIITRGPKHVSTSFIR